MSEQPKQRKRQDFEVPQGSIPEPCKACGAPLVFVLHPRTLNRMPLSMRTLEIREGKGFAESHFSDCPKPGRFRRRGPRS